ncbi:hypothetical protein [Streptomyces sp. NPDC029041]|uniref:hypothetical protein n=1 Tax=Streptomyces sp. NPDC029041 TaxID=3155727 RepID=UPI0033CC131F
MAQQSARGRLSGTWTHTFDGKGAVKGIGVWELSRNGSFAFRWREANALMKMNFSSWSGEWDVTDADPLRLHLNAKKVRAPLQYAIDAAYLVNPGTALIAGFRAAMVAVNHAGGNKMKGAAMRLQVDLQEIGDGPDELRLVLDDLSFAKLSYWRILLKDETSSINWHRF